MDLFSGTFIIEDTTIPFMLPHFQNHSNNSLSETKDKLPFVCYSAQTRPSKSDNPLSVADNKKLFKLIDCKSS